MAAPRQGWLANYVKEGLVPMDCPGCLASLDVPVSGQLSLVKQGVVLNRGDQGRGCCGGSRGVRPRQSTAALIFARTLGAVFRPELVVLKTHLQASDSGLENGYGCSSPPPQQSVAIALSSLKHPHGDSLTGLIFELSKLWFSHLGLEPRLFRLVGSRHRDGLGHTQCVLEVTPGS